MDTIAHKTRHHLAIFMERANGTIGNVVKINSGKDVQKAYLCRSFFCWNKCDFLRINIHLFANRAVDFGVGVGEATEDHFFYGSGKIAQNCFKGD